MPARYAVYYAPDPGSALDRFGEAWLGRSARTGASVPQISVPDIEPDRLRELTAEPRRYGFHGTLKPPFHLREASDVAALGEAAAAFAASRVPFLLPPLRLAALGRFLALVPSAPSPELAALAADAVRALDGFRAPPSQAELARRRRGGLTARQEELLAQWGYPYVMDAFRFHLTLTGPLEPADRDRLAAVLEPLTTDLCRDPVRVDSVCLFEEPQPGEPFVVAAHLPFAK